MRREPVAAFHHFARSFRIKTLVGVRNRLTPEPEEKGEKGKENQREDRTTHSPAIVPAECRCERRGLIISEGWPRQSLSSARRTIGASSATRRCARFRRRDTRCSPST